MVFNVFNKIFMTKDKKKPQWQPIKDSVKKETISYNPIQGLSKNRKRGISLIDSTENKTYWNPFDNKSGNYNMSVIGRAGAGKTIFIDELIRNSVIQKNRVMLLMDDERFSKSASNMGGLIKNIDNNFEGFVNPFSLLSSDDEDINSDHKLLEIIYLIFLEICKPSSKEEENLIRKIFIETADKYGNKATMANFRQIAKAEGGILSEKILQNIKPFTARGKFGKLFKNNKEITTKDNLILLINLHYNYDYNRENIEQIGALLIMFNFLLLLKYSILSKKENNGINNTLVIGRIWESFDRNKSKYLKHSVEIISKTLANYNSNIISFAQGFGEYCQNPSSKTLIQNSDYLFIFKIGMCCRENLKQYFSEINKSISDDLIKDIGCPFSHDSKFGFDYKDSKISRSKLAIYENGNVNFFKFGV